MTKHKAIDYSQYNNRRWKLLELEKYEINKTYSMTLNLKSSCDSLQEDYDNYKYYLSLFKPNIEFLFHFELSPIGKMHIHGYITFLSYEHIVRFIHKVGLLKERFSIEISIIQNIKEYDSYISKQQIYLSTIFKTPLANKDISNKLLAVKIRDQIEDSMFNTHLDD